MNILVALVIVIVSTITGVIIRDLHRDITQEIKRKKLEDQIRREKEAYEQSMIRERKREEERLKAINS